MTTKKTDAECQHRKGCKATTRKCAANGAASGGGAEEEVGAGDGVKRTIGGPGGKERGQGVDVADATSKMSCDQAQVGDGQADGGGDAGDASPRLPMESAKGMARTAMTSVMSGVCDLLVELLR